MTRKVHKSGVSRNTLVNKKTSGGATMNLMNTSNEPKTIEDIQKSIDEVESFISKIIAETLTEVEGELLPYRKLNSVEENLEQIQIEIETLLKKIDEHPNMDPDRLDNEFSSIESNINDQIRVLTQMKKEGEKINESISIGPISKMLEESAETVDKIEEIIANTNAKNTNGMSGGSTLFRIPIIMNGQKKQFTFQADFKAFLNNINTQNQPSEPVSGSTTEPLPEPQPRPEPQPPREVSNRAETNFTNLFSKLGQTRFKLDSDKIKQIRQAEGTIYEKNKDIFDQLMNDIIRFEQYVTISDNPSFSMVTESGNPILQMVPKSVNSYLCKFNYRFYIFLIDAIRKLRLSVYLNIYCFDDPTIKTKKREVKLKEIMDNLDVNNTYLDTNVSLEEIKKICKIMFDRFKQEDLFKQLDEKGVTPDRTSLEFEYLNNMLVDPYQLSYTDNTLDTHKENVRIKEELSYIDNLKKREYDNKFEMSKTQYDDLKEEQIIKTLKLVYIQNQELYRIEIDRLLKMDYYIFENEYGNYGTDGEILIEYKDGIFLKDDKHIDQEGNLALIFLKKIIDKYLLTPIKPIPAIINPHETSSYIETIMISGDELIEKDATLYLLENLATSVQRYGDSEIREIFTEVSRNQEFRKEIEAIDSVLLTDEEIEELKKLESSVLNFFDQEVGVKDIEEKIQIKIREKNERMKQEMEESKKQIKANMDRRLNPAQEASTRDFSAVEAPSGVVAVEESTRDFNSAEAPAPPAKNLPSSQTVIESARTSKELKKDKNVLQYLSPSLLNRERVEKAAANSSENLDDNSVAVSNGSDYQSLAVSNGSDDNSLAVSNGSDYQSVAFSKKLDDNRVDPSERQTVSISELFGRLMAQQDSLPESEKNPKLIEILSQRSPASAAAPKSPASAAASAASAAVPKSPANENDKKKLADSLKIKLDSLETTLLNDNIQLKILYYLVNHPSDQSETQKSENTTKMNELMQKIILLELKIKKIKKSLNLDLNPESEQDKFFKIDKNLLERLETGSDEKKKDLVRKIKGFLSQLLLFEEKLKTPNLPLYEIKEAIEKGDFFMKQINIEYKNLITMSGGGLGDLFGYIKRGFKRIIFGNPLTPEQQDIKTIIKRIVYNVVTEGDTWTGDYMDDHLNKFSIFISNNIEPALHFDDLNAYFTRNKKMINEWIVNFTTNEPTLNKFNSYPTNQIPSINEYRKIIYKHSQYTDEHIRVSMFILNALTELNRSTSDVANFFLSTLELLYNSDQTVIKIKNNKFDFIKHLSYEDSVQLINMTQSKFIELFISGIDMLLSCDFLIEKFTKESYLLDVYIFIFDYKSAPVDFTVESQLFSLSILKNNLTKKDSYWLQLLYIELMENITDNKEVVLLLQESKLYSMIGDHFYHNCKKYEDPLGVDNITYYNKLEQNKYLYSFCLISMKILFDTKKMIDPFVIFEELFTYSNQESRNWNYTPQTRFFGLMSKDPAELVNTASVYNQPSVYHYLTVELTSSLTKHQTSRIFNQKISNYSSETMSHKIVSSYKEEALKAFLSQMKEEKTAPGENPIYSVLTNAIAMMAGGPYGLAAIHVANLIKGYIATQTAVTAKKNSEQRNKMADLAAQLSDLMISKKRLNTSLSTIETDEKLRREGKDTLSVESLALYNSYMDIASKTAAVDQHGAIIRYTPGEGDGIITYKSRLEIRKKEFDELITKATNLSKYGELSTSILRGTTEANIQSYTDHKRSISEYEDALKKLEIKNKKEDEETRRKLEEAKGITDQQIMLENNRASNAESATKLVQSHEEKMKKMSDEYEIKKMRRVHQYNREESSWSVERSNQEHAQRMKEATHAQGIKDADRASEIIYRGTLHNQKNAAELAQATSLQSLEMAGEIAKKNLRLEETVAKNIIKSGEVAMDHYVTLNLEMLKDWENWNNFMDYYTYESQKIMKTVQDETGDTVSVEATCRRVLNIEISGFVLVPRKIMIALSTARNYKYDPNDPVVKKAIEERNCTQLKASSFQHNPETESYYKYYFLTTKQFQENLSHMALERYNTYLTSTAFHGEEDKLLAELESTNNNGMLGTLVIGIGVAVFAAVAWPAGVVTGLGVALFAGTVALGGLLTGDVISIDSIQSALGHIKDAATIGVLKGVKEMLLGLEKERLAEESKKEAAERRLKDIKKRIEGLADATARTEAEREAETEISTTNTALTNAKRKLEEIKGKETDAQTSAKTKIKILHDEAVEKDKQEHKKNKGGGGAPGRIVPSMASVGANAVVACAMKVTGAITKHASDKASTKYDKGVKQLSERRSELIGIAREWLTQYYINVASEKGVTLDDELKQMMIIEDAKYTTVINPTPARQETLKAAQDGVQAGLDAWNQPNKEALEETSQMNKANADREIKKLEADRARNAANKNAAAQRARDSAEAQRQREEREKDAKAKAELEKNKNPAEGKKSTKGENTPEVNTPKKIENPTKGGDASTPGLTALGVSSQTNGGSLIKGGTAPEPQVATLSDSDEKNWLGRPVINHTKSQQILEENLRAMYKFGNEQRLIYMSDEDINNMINTFRKGYSDRIATIPKPIMGVPKLEELKICVDKSRVITRRVIETYKMIDSSIRMLDNSLPDEKTFEEATTFLTGLGLTPNTYIGPIKSAVNYIKKGTTKYIITHNSKLNSAVKSGKTIFSSFMEKKGGTRLQNKSKYSIGKIIKQKIKSRRKKRLN